MTLSSALPQFRIDQRHEAGHDRADPSQNVTCHVQSRSALGNHALKGRVAQEIIVGRHER